MSANGRARESPQQESPQQGIQQGIQSIEVGAQVLRALEAGRGPMALSEVARNCAMHPAKVPDWRRRTRAPASTTWGRPPVTSAWRRCAARTRKASPRPTPRG
jgi:hypothetical protein